MLRWFNQDKRSFSFQGYFLPICEPDDKLFFFCVYWEYAKKDAGNIHVDVNVTSF